VVEDANAKLNAKLAKAKEALEAMSDKEKIEYFQSNSWTNKNAELGFRQRTPKPQKTQTGTTGNGVGNRDICGVISSATCSVQC
jgi:hypothetical protein